MSYKPLERYSHSSLETYRKCPSQFKFRYLDGIRKKDESIETFMGKRIHEAIEYLYNEVLENRIPFFDHIVDKFNTNWKNKWHDRVGIYYSYNSAEFYRNLGEDCLARYYRKYSPFQQQIVGNEIQIEFSLDREGKYPLKGIIDRLDHDGDGNWEIHDYKSGKNLLTQKQADNDSQLALYQIGLISKEENIKSIKLIWHFLQHGIEIHSKRTDEQLKKLASSIKNRIKVIKKAINVEQEFPAKKSILCNWCYYWEECPEQIGTNPFIK